MTTTIGGPMMSSTVVRRALKFIKSKGSITAAELVEWDASHGRRLFNWDTEDAAHEYRLHQARLFLNRFRHTFEGMRLRAFIHLREDEAEGIATDAYYSVATITEHPGMRDQVVRDISRRMASLASELRMWNLSEEERSHLLQLLEKAMA